MQEGTNVFCRIIGYDDIQLYWGTKEMNSFSFEEAIIAKNSIQLLNVSLHELICSRGEGEDTKLNVRFQHRVGQIDDDNRLQIYLKVDVGFEKNGPFNITCVHEGLVKSAEEIDEEDLIQYADNQIVPLLLPYARECIASTLIRMQLPPYTLPTIDVLKTIAINSGATVVKE